MSKRNTQIRRDTIVTLISQQGEVTVEELSKKFETSEVTIRKDLAYLEQSNQLLRRYGGAVALPLDTTQDDANSTLSKAKLDLAKAAAALIQDHNRIIIDHGSTTGALIPHLEAKRGLVIMTNSLKLANDLSEIDSEPTLLMTGGTWDSHSDSFQGQVAESALRSYDFDQLFVGADGIDLERGTTTFNELMGLSRVMAEVSREVIVMIESDKIGRRIPNLELAWEAIDVLVTDAELTQQQIQTIESKQVRVIRASE
ncbi:DeoR/GlpR family DNA-binding transcription regulator [Vibrio gallicus]|uniref:DeoR/GlpR family DNA-binding transcription regulator n=1 Tax=Vibrio gallicus TaxID=190897 RepID=UPI0021C43693|nr:DeoR family transcriptional regulator [Vibrio gallicus]